MRAAPLWVVAIVLAAPGFARAEPQKDPSFRAAVSAGPHGCLVAPVSIEVDLPNVAPAASSSDWLAAVTCEGKDVPAQAHRTGRKVRVTWIVTDLAPGKSRTYTGRLFTTQGFDAPKPVVEARQKSGNVEIHSNGEMVTRYDSTTGPNKPYFYPVFAPGGKRLTRGWPIESIAGETSRDHPHHRGLWFTHGDVNGQDYWSEGGKTAKTVNTGIEDIQSGPVCGGFRAKTDWIDNTGKKVAEDVRDVTVYETPQGRLMDFAVTIRPVGGPLVLGDTKEGSFGLRVPDSMRVAGGSGHIVTSAGITDARAWSTRADWVDYYGPVDGATVGIAILDAPGNPRHPTYWHVRDYGLFAANPFGVHDFVKGQVAHAGDLAVPAGGSITFRYRLLLHSGTAEQARVAEIWSAYAEPPTVRLAR